MQLAENKINFVIQETTQAQNGKGDVRNSHLQTNYYRKSYNMINEGKINHHHRSIQDCTHQNGVCCDKIRGTIEGANKYQWKSQIMRKKYIQ